MVDYVKEIDEIIKTISSSLGKPIDKKLYKVIDRGLPHQPQSLPNGAMGVYIFFIMATF